MTAETMNRSRKLDGAEKSSVEDDCICDCAPKRKRQKIFDVIHQAAATIENSDTITSNVGATELASAFALATLATAASKIPKIPPSPMHNPSANESMLSSMSPPTKPYTNKLNLTTKIPNTEDESRDADNHYNTDSLSGPCPVSPEEQRSPVQQQQRVLPGASNAGKRVTFSQDTKLTTKSSTDLKRNGKLSRTLSFPPRKSSRPQKSRLPAGFGRTSTRSSSTTGLPSQKNGSTKRWCGGAPQPSQAEVDKKNEDMSSVHQNDKWICDYCNEAAFDTFQEACVHEQGCKHNIAATQNNRQQQIQQHHKHHNAPSPHFQHQFQHQQQPHHSRNPNILQQLNQPLLTHRSNPSSGNSAIAANSKSWYEGSCKLSLASDANWLSAKNCFLRDVCVEAFSVSPQELSVHQPHTTTLLKMGAVGIRCVFCKNMIPTTAAAAVCFPVSVAGIYDAVKRLHMHHIPMCHAVPHSVHRQLSQLALTVARVSGTRQYWIDSALSMGLVDTTDGLRFGATPNMTPSVNIQHQMSKPMHRSNGPVHHYRVAGAQHQVLNRTVSDSSSIMGVENTPLSNSSASNMTTAPKEKEQPSHNCSIPVKKGSGGIVTGAGMPGGEFIVSTDDTAKVPPYVYFLMQQVESTHFTEADRFVARSKGPVGYPGFQCRHCHGHAGLGRYFPVTCKSLSTNSTSQNIHSHMLKCQKVEECIKDQLVTLKEEKSKAPRLEPGWRRVFFDKIWSRLHG